MDDRSVTSRLLPDPGGSGVTGAQARTAARTLLAPLDLTATGVEDVMTVVTELVSNAERHAGGVTAFTLTARPLPSTITVTVEVTDREPRLPELQAWAPERPGGFGWRIVHHLADTVHVRAHGDGKTITATFTDKQLRSAGAGTEPGPGELR
ncbi:ATP-binding protein [Streptomyces sp. NPDC048507]|uniref:ATP-binding protein n=1 Tax=Streptomyces sp. NPDC048507 TaxID=3365560 RepID=UPI00371C95B8